MKITAIDKILEQGNDLMRLIGRASRESFSVRIGWAEGFSRRTIKHEEAVLGDILTSMRGYMQNNLQIQQELIKAASSVGQVTIGDQLSVIQSQKHSIEVMIATYIDTISYHRSELNTVIGHILTTSAVGLALLSIIITIGR